VFTHCLDPGHIVSGDYIQARGCHSLGPQLNLAKPWDSWNSPATSHLLSHQPAILYPYPFA